MASRGFKSTAETLLQDFGVDLAAAGIKHLSNENNVNRALALIEQSTKRKPTTARGLAAWQRATAPRPDRFMPKLAFGFAVEEAAVLADVLAVRRARHAATQRESRARRMAGLPPTQHGAAILRGMKMTPEQRLAHRRERARRDSAKYRAARKAAAFSLFAQICHLADLSPH
jgi:hypothetical protein